MRAPIPFVKALGQETIPCATPGCPGPVASIEQSQPDDRIKVFEVHCEQCGWTDCIAGQQELDPPWDDGSLTEIIDEHLLHLEPLCPFDHSPVHFHSLPNPRRKARYRISCFFCGRQTELDWPPPDAKW